MIFLKRRNRTAISIVCLISFGFFEKASWTDLAFHKAGEKIEKRWNKFHKSFWLLESRCRPKAKAGIEIVFKHKLNGLFGEKNVSNAAGAILVLLSLGFAEYKIEKAIRLFYGAKRRFEKVEESDSMTLFDDYAHHPHEISATIEAARRRFPHRRLVIIFQPHTFSRTLSLKTEFLEALSHADLALIAPIFPSARESYPQPPITAGDLEELARKAGKTNVFGYDSNNKLVDAVSIMHRPGDVIFTMGAGDIYKLKDRLKAV